LVWSWLLIQSNIIHLILYHHSLHYIILSYIHRQWKHELTVVHAHFYLVPILLSDWTYAPIHLLLLVEFVWLAICIPIIIAIVYIVIILVIINTPIIIIITNIPIAMTIQIIMIIVWLMVFIVIVIIIILFLIAVLLIVNIVVLILIVLILIVIVHIHRHTLVPILILVVISNLLVFLSLPYWLIYIINLQNMAFIHIKLFLFLFHP